MHDYHDPTEYRTRLNPERVALAVLATVLFLITLADLVEVLS
jgi:hypothetical protein